MVMQTFNQVFSWMADLKACPLLILPRNPEWQDVLVVLEKTTLKLRVTMTLLAMLQANHVS